VSIERTRQFPSALAPSAGRLGLIAMALAASIGLAPGASAEDALSVATWGGAYGQSQEAALFEPFARKTGTAITTEIYDGSLAKLKTMIGGRKASVDVIDVSASALDALCSDGLLEKIETSSLSAAPDGPSVEEDFLAGGLSDCGVASVAWSTAIAFDRKAFRKGQPTQISALLDKARFPGKRALPNNARRTLELALLADGVSPENVYSELGTEAGADRAFAALDKIKNDILFWDNAGQPISWLLDKKVVMAAGYSGRIFRTVVGNRQRIGVLWSGQIYDVDAWAIPKTAKNKKGAMRFIRFATEPAQLAAQARLIAYGPMRKSAVPLVGRHPVINVEMQEFLPTAPDNFTKALKFDEAWWTKNGKALNMRFAVWQTGIEKEVKPEPAGDAAP
jgi:putative spermidine/putrescine transport system substrate-binding protein